MISSIYRIIPLTFLLCISVTSAQGIHYEHPIVNTMEPGVRAAGMGGAFRAIADDYSAVYYNPAGLTQIKRFELTASLMHDRHYNTVTYSGHEAAFDNKATRFGNIGLVAPYPVYQGGLAFAVGLTRTHSFDAVTGLEVTSGNVVTDRFKEVPNGGLSQWSLAGGIDLSPTISSGIALNLLTGGNYIEYNALDTDSTGLKTYFNDLTDLSYSGVNAAFGLLVRSGRFVKWGLTVTSPTVLNEEGIIQQSDDTDPSFPSPYTTSAMIENSIVVPWKFAGGTAVYTPWLVASFDAEYIDWEQLRYNDRIDEEHREVINLAAGVETIIPGPGIKLRAGYAHKPVVFKYQTGVSEERRTLAFGAGFLVDKIMAIDLAYTLRFWQTENLQYSLPIVEDHRGHLVQLSGSYRF